MPSTGAFRLNGLLGQFVPHPVATLMAPPLEVLLALRKLERAYQSMTPDQHPVAFAAGALKALDVRFDCSPDDRARIPAAGPLIVVANHPFGGIEGLYLLSMLAERRADVRVLGNHLLTRFGQLTPVVFPVDVLGGRAAAKANASAMRRALRWVADGGALIVFPAGEVSAFDPRFGTITDAPWQPSIARLVTMARATVVPAYFGGANSALFQFAGMVHPRLRTALLPRELFNKGNQCIRVRVGTPIEPARVAEFDGEQRLVDHLRLRTYALATEASAPPVARACAPRREALVDQVPAERLAGEIAALPQEQRLASMSGLEVWHARAEQAPWVMQEIGRLRESTFRAVGEGTGRASDIDLYDRYYEQLFVWSPGQQEIVGGYRLGQAEDVVSRYGKRGLYTHTLFEYREPLLGQLGCALELGRSFVRPEYQKSFAPLLLLWKGIGAYVAAHPRFAALFGPVSISDDYTLASKTLLVEYLRLRHGDPVRMKLVRGRHGVQELECTKLLRREVHDVQSLEDLESVIQSLEPDGKGVPVLLRQYLKLGSRVLGFNVDPAFGHSIDVLLRCDLRVADERVLAKYMGREGSLAYLAHHAPRAITRQAQRSRGAR